MGGKKRSTVVNLSKALAEVEWLLDKYPGYVGENRRIASLHRQYLQKITELVRIEEDTNIVYALLPGGELKPHTVNWAQWGCLPTGVDGGNWYYSVIMHSMSVATTQIVKMEEWNDESLGDVIEAILAVAVGEDVTLDESVAARWPHAHFFEMYTLIVDAVVLLNQIQIWTENEHDIWLVSVLFSHMLQTCAEQGAPPVQEAFLHVDTESIPLPSFRGRRV